MNVFIFYTILSVGMIAALVLPRIFYKIDFVEGIGFEFFSMGTCFFAWVGSLRGTDTSFFDLGMLSQVLIVFAFISMIDCGYLLFKYHR